MNHVDNVPVTKEMNSSIESEKYLPLLIGSHELNDIFNWEFISSGVMLCQELGSNFPLKYSIARFFGGASKSKQNRKNPVSTPDVWKLLELAFY